MPDVAGSDTHDYDVSDWATLTAAKLFPEPLFPDPDDPTTWDEAELAARGDYADGLRRLAGGRHDSSLHLLADAICSLAVVDALATFVSAYLGSSPVAMLLGVPPGDDTLAALRAATRDLLRADPRSDYELAWKIRLVAVVGIHNRLRKQFRLPDPAAVIEYRRLWDDLDRLPLWLVAGALDHRFRPDWINALDPPANRDAILVREAVQDAGPVARASIADAIERLRRRHPSRAERNA